MTRLGSKYAQTLPPEVKEILVQKRRRRSNVDIEKSVKFKNKLFETEVQCDGNSTIFRLKEEKSKSGKKKPKLRLVKFVEILEDDLASPKTIAKKNEQVNNLKKEILISNLVSEGRYKSLVDFEDTVEETNASGKKVQVTGTFKGIVMPFVEGETLRSIMMDKKNLTQDQLFKIILLFLLAVEKYQQLDVSHRDLKPENVLYDAENEKLTIIDFGEPKFIDEFAYTVGTLNYLAPEWKGRYEEPLKVAVSLDNYAAGKVIEDLLDSASAIVEPEIKDKIVQVAKRLTLQDPAKRCTSTDAIKVIEDIRLNAYQNKNETAVFANIQMAHNLAVTVREKHNRIFKVCNALRLEQCKQAYYDIDLNKRENLLQQSAVAAHTGILADFPIIGYFFRGHFLGANKEPQQQDIFSKVNLGQLEKNKRGKEELLQSLKEAIGELPEDSPEAIKEFINTVNIVAFRRKENHAMNKKALLSMIEEQESNHIQHREELNKQLKVLNYLKKQGNHSKYADKLIIKCEDALLMLTKFNGSFDGLIDINCGLKKESASIETKINKKYGNNKDLGQFKEILNLIEDQKKQPMIPLQKEVLFSIERYVNFSSNRDGHLKRVERLKSILNLLNSKEITDESLRAAVSKHITHIQHEGIFGYFFTNNSQLARELTKALAAADSSLLEKESKGDGDANRVSTSSRA
ncbi:MAG TPA: hypothetical protein VHZ76_02485 [Gammaproteobacteria bacterium]|jgi:serine/threonine protein kinase|nr:hypothetical protein [Gammaproteobacteria bacterium]